MGGFSTLQRAIRPIYFVDFRPKSKKSKSKSKNGRVSVTLSNRRDFLLRLVQTNEQRALHYSIPSICCLLFMENGVYIAHIYSNKHCVTMISLINTNYVRFTNDLKNLQK